MKWLNPDNHFWKSRYKKLGKFVPQTIRMGMQATILGIYGAIPTGTAIKVIDSGNCNCGEYQP